MSEQQTPPDTVKREIAFYYPGPMWSSAAWIKNLLLFFDGVGLLVPAYMKDRPEWTCSRTGNVFGKIFLPQVCAVVTPSERLTITSPMRYASIAVILA